MELVGGDLRLSATDLVGHLNCRHLTVLNRAVAAGTLQKPFLHDPMLEVLRERGARHEAEYVAHLEAQGLAVTRIEGVGIDANAVAATLDAMRAGAQIIVQAALKAGRWVGRADVLLRVETPSALGDWSYEPVDTKLARDTKAGSVLQLCLYAELLMAAQGVQPQHGHVVAPWSEFEPQTFRVADYAAYFRRVKAGLEADLAKRAGEATYPEPVEHCDVCRWRQRCDARRRGDDHLSLVAGISQAQRKELVARGVGALAALAVEPLPLAWKPERGTAESMMRVREQARLQLEGRLAGALLYELLPFEAGQGLARLPAPSPGDLFLDLEGDPFAGEGGLEYLFGGVAIDGDKERYLGTWALDRSGERAAFERFMDMAIERLERWPDLHIYHYAPYEPSAMKRLAGRYATREEELDRLLRGGVFVDLYAVVRQGLRASVESYSIKRLEPLYGFERDVTLPDANLALATLQAELELGDPEAIDGEVLRVVEGYNRDDCVSTLRLRDWLEARRAEAVAEGAEIARPAVVATEAPEATAAWLARIQPIMDQLLAGVPDDRDVRTAEQQARGLLANLLDFHRREQKATWWEYFRLADLADDDLLDERAALAGLTFDGIVGGTNQAPVCRYRFPPQETELRGGEDLKSTGGEAYGKVVAVSLDEGWVDVKKTQKTSSVHSSAVFAHRAYPIGVLQESLLRLGEYVAAHGLDGEGAYQAGRDLLLRQAPPFGGGPLQKKGESPLDASLRLADAMAPGVLPIQGPPGTGKTFTGARMICRLVAGGKTVAVTANSHKVVRNLLDEVVKAAEEDGIDLTCLQKPDEPEDDLPRLQFVTDNAAVFEAIGDCQVAGGTAWLWSRPEAFETVDVLVVDEAAQMSLANVLAVAQCAKSLILLGDPQQLDQPLQGSHPEGTEASALEHLLRDAPTIAPDRGLFLGETWRLHPSICAFTSELFYGGRLGSLPGLESQALRNAGDLSGFGLRYEGVTHSGNAACSSDEADRIAGVVGRLLSTGATWIDAKGAERLLTWDDVLIIAPYNAQVFELKSRLPGARVGTVDKFQGQQAPLVIYSMATSSHADAPRGMEFLYSRNRLNVATSRAKCVCLVVASPDLFAAECRTPRQMQLVNALCRYAELADQAGVPAPVSVLAE
jgi:predicted RecB family nuclease